VLCWARPLLVLSSSPASSGAGLWSLLRGLQPVGGLLGLLLVLLARAPEDDAAGYLSDGDGDVQLAGHAQDVALHLSVPIIHPAALSRRGSP
jgi:hypothetical protein